MQLHENGSALLIIDGQFVYPETYRLTINRPPDRTEIAKQLPDDSMSIKFNFETRQHVMFPSDEFTFTFLNRETVVTFRDGFVRQTEYTTDDMFETTIYCTEFVTEEDWMESWS